MRWADFDAATGELPVEAVASLLGPRTKVVAVTAASNLLGTRPDVPAIAAAARDAGALAFVDGVHLTPHAPVDVAALGADVYACSPYKFFGPHLGLLAADPALLETVQPAKLRPQTDAVPERFELGTLPYELLAGVTAAVDFIAGLVPGEGSRRERVLASMAEVEAQEDVLFGSLLARLGEIDGVTLHGRATHRTPTALFSVRDRTPQQVYELLAERGVNAPGGSFYALEAAEWMGLGEPGANRAGLAPYTNQQDVDRLVEGVAALVWADLSACGRTSVQVRTTSLCHSADKSPGRQSWTPRVSAPSTTRCAPDVRLDTGLARNTTADALSDGSPI